MAKSDYYQVLGVSKDANEADLKKAYRRLAMKYHPDRAPDSAVAEDKFKEAKEAFEVLGDAQKRAAYDRFGHAGVDGSAGMGGGQGAGNFNGIFGDVFGDIFGGSRGGGRQAYRSSDLQYNLEASLEDAVNGTTVKVKIPTEVICGTCDGSGARAGTASAACATCNGVGQVRMQQGFFSVQQTCPRCHGAGQVIKEPCNKCCGRGRVEENKTLSVKIPAGVDTGDRIRLSGEGEAGERGGPRGDLYVQISVKSHPIFERDNADLLCQVPINVVSASMGGELEVPTLSGRVKLKIPPGTQSEKVFRLRGKGIKPVRGGTVGDLLCKVRVETPVNLTLEQKKLFEQLRESFDGKSGSQHSPQESSWLNGVKKFFDNV